MLDGVCFSHSWNCFFFSAFALGLQPLGNFVALVAMVPFGEMEARRAGRAAGLDFFDGNFEPVYFVCSYYLL